MRTTASAATVTASGALDVTRSAARSTTDERHLAEVIDRARSRAARSISALFNGS